MNQRGDECQNIFMDLLHKGKGCMFNHIKNLAKMYGVTGAILCSND